MQNSRKWCAEFASYMRIIFDFLAQNSDNPAITSRLRQKHNVCSTVIILYTLICSTVLLNYFLLTYHWSTMHLLALAAAWLPWKFFETETFWGAFWHIKSIEKTNSMTVCKGLWTISFNFGLQFDFLEFSGFCRTQGIPGYDLGMCLSECSSDSSSEQGGEEGWGSGPAPQFPSVKWSAAQSAWVRLGTCNYWFSGCYHRHNYRCRGQATAGGECVHLIFNDCGYNPGWCRIHPTVSEMT